MHFPAVWLWCIWVLSGVFSSHGQDLKPSEYRFFWSLVNSTTCVQSNYQGSALNCTGELKAGAAYGSPAGVVFGGAGARMDVPYAAALNTLSFTVELWMVVTGGAGTIRSPLTSRGPCRGYMFYCTGDDVMRAQFGFNNGAQLIWHGIEASGPRTCVPNQWFHLAFAYNRSTLAAEFYVNGLLQGFAVTTLTPNINGVFRLGSGLTEDGPDASDFDFVGTVASVVYYNSARSKLQIQADLAETTPGALSGSFLPLPVVPEPSSSSSASPVSSSSSSGSDGSSSDGSSSSSTSAATVALAAIGGVVVLLLLLFACMRVHQRKQQQHHQQQWQADAYLEQQQQQQQQPQQQPQQQQPQHHPHHQPSAPPRRYSDPASAGALAYTTMTANEPGSRPSAPALQLQVMDVATPRRNSDKSIDGTCKICMDRKLSTTVVPCGHASMCRPCADTMQRALLPCPICRGPIASIVNIYF